MRAGEALRFKRDLSHNIRTHYGEYAQSLLTSLRNRPTQLERDTLGNVITELGLPTVKDAEVLYVGQDVMDEYLNRALGPEPKQLGAVNAIPYVSRGLVIFERPITLNPNALLESASEDDDAVVHFPITAMSWATGKVPAIDGMTQKVIWKDGVLVILWSSKRDIRQTFKAGGEDVEPTLVAYPMSFASAVFGGWFLPEPGGAFTPDEDNAGFYDGDTPESAAMATAIVMAHTLWEMLSEELLLSRKVDANKRQKKMLRKAKMTDTGISVIELRHVTYVGGDPQDGEDRIIDWSHRWYVRGHARRIRDRKTGEIKVVWVKPYIKGPDGKPLRVTEKVYALKR